jgi:serine/threonine-protein kinase
VYEGHYTYHGLKLVPTWGGSMFEALMVTLFVPEEQWGPQSWGVNHPVYVQAQIEHGLLEARYGYWGFSPARDPAGGYRAYIVMELLDGQPLSAILRDGPMTPERTAAVMSQAAAALAAAHEQQIVHRDIKPANVMVDSAGRVTVLDFGIARAADAVALTATDMVLGTARYISPEQADGRGASPASDVYALGVVAFECLSGHVPYDVGSDVAIALAHLRDPIPDLPANVPESIASLVRQMLANAPKDRPSAASVAERLDGAPGQADDSTAAATVIALPEAGSAAGPQPTAVMPAVMAAGHRVRDHLAGRDLGETRSAPLRLRLVAVPAAVIVLALLIALIATSGGSGGTPAAAAGAKGTHAATHHAAVHKVTIDPSLYVGQDWAAVRKALLALGVEPTPQFAGEGDTETVVGLAPTGKVAKGTVITVVVARSGHVHEPKPPKVDKHPKPAEHHVPPGQAKKYHEKRH